MPSPFVPGSAYSQWTAIDREVNPATYNALASTAQIADLVAGGYFVDG